MPDQDHHLKTSPEIPLSSWTEEGLVASHTSSDSGEGLLDPESDEAYEEFVKSCMDRERGLIEKDLQSLVYMIDAGMNSAKMTGAHGIDEGEFRRLTKSIARSHDSSGWIDELVGAFYELECMRLVDEEGSREYFMGYVECAPSGVLRKLYGDENSNLRRYLGQAPETHEDAARMLRVLNLARGHEENPGREYDKIREVIDDPVDFKIAAIPTSPETTAEISEYRELVAEEVTDICRDLLLDDEVAQAYLRNATIRQSGWREDGVPMPGAYDGREVRTDMHRMATITRGVGPSIANSMMKEFEIETLETYAPETIKTLDGLHRKDDEMIAYMQAGDSSVIFFDARGDHNGVLSAGVTWMQKKTGRSIMLEIKSPRDIIERMDWLRSLGIKPSTVVIAAHGEPGSVTIGRNETAFIVHAPARQGVSLVERIPMIPQQEMGLDAVMSDQYTQPIRDDDKKRGRKELVLISCSSDVESERFRYTYAEAMARSVGNTAVDVTAARGDAVFNVDTEGKVTLRDIDRNKPWYAERRGDTNMVRLRSRTDKDGVLKVRRRIHVPFLRINARDGREDKDE